MKELKDFLKELEELDEPHPADNDTVYIDEAKRLISEAYIAGINFQASQVKGCSPRE